MSVMLPQTDDVIHPLLFTVCVDSTTHPALSPHGVRGLVTPNFQMWRLRLGVTHSVSWVLCGPVASGVSELYRAPLNLEVTTLSPALDGSGLPGSSLHSGLRPGAPAPLKVSTSIFGKGHSWLLISAQVYYFIYSSQGP